VGLNLQHAASCCINIELPWNPAVLEQRIGRIHRMGQSRPVEVYNLVSAGGLESRIEALVETKRAMFKGLFDGDSDAVSFEHSGSFLSRVERLLTPATPSSGGPEPEPELDEAPVDPEGPELIDTMAPQGEVAGPVATAPEDPEPSVEAGAHLAGLFSQLKVRQLENGGLSLEAPPEAAVALTALFQGMANLLASVTPAGVNPLRP
jgi:hypothetical protein